MLIRLAHTSASVGLGISGTARAVSVSKHFESSSVLTRHLYNQGFRRVLKSLMKSWFDFVFHGLKNVLNLPKFILQVLKGLKFCS